MALAADDESLETAVLRVWRNWWIMTDDDG